MSLGEPIFSTLEFPGAVLAMLALRVQGGPGGPGPGRRGADRGDDRNQPLGEPVPQSHEEDGPLAQEDGQSKELIRIRTTDAINAEVVCALRAEIAARHPQQALTLVMANARYQHCALVESRAAALGSELLCLPAYSPHLHLLERRWKLVKKRGRTNRSSEDLAKLRAAMDDGLDALSGAAKAELDSLLTLKFQCFGKLKTCRASV